MKTNPIGATSRHFYNKNGQLCKQIKPIEYEKNKEAGACYHYFYDAYNRLSQVIDPIDQVVETNTYDLEGRLVQKLDALQSGIIYTYDLGSRQEKIETTGGASQYYAHDARGNVKDGNGQRTTYRLDKWGRISQIYKPNETTESYTYDFAGNIVTTTDAKQQTITYNFNNINKLS